MMRSVIALLLALSLIGLSPQTLAEEEKEGEETSPPKKALYLALSPPFVVNLSSGSKRRFMQVKAQLMSYDSDIIDAIKHHMPAVRHTMLMLLAHQTAATMYDVQAREALRQQALDDLRKVLDEQAGIKEGLEALYFTDFVIQ